MRSATEEPGGSLRGKRALVTGASRGIGEAIARRLAGQGADVVLAARSAPPIEALAGELAEGGVRALAVPADLTDRGSLAALMDLVREKFGGLDILVNNAGVLPEAKRAERIGWLEWDATLGLNLSAPWYLACRAKELMGSRGGVVVNNASTASYYPSRGLAAYNVGKAGLVMLTRVLALEWARLDQLIARRRPHVLPQSVPRILPPGAGISTRLVGSDAPGWSCCPRCRLVSVTLLDPLRGR